MKDTLRVLACIDLSEYSKMIVEHAVEIVKGLQSEIILFNVIDSKDVAAVEELVPHLSNGLTVERYIERTKTEHHDKILGMIEKDFSLHKEQMRILVHVGIPYDAVLKAIETEKVDLVVIASKGKSNLIGTLHGSNSEKVFRHSPVPVLSVRDPDTFGQTRNREE